MSMNTGERAMSDSRQDVLIEIEGLTKRFGAFTAVDAVSFTVARGEVLGFLGPNGAGKSTTMRMLAGFMIPTAGTARLMGHDVQTDGVAARRVLGFLPEGAPTYGEMSVTGFLRFCARVRGYAGRELLKGYNLKDSARSRARDFAWRSHRLLTDVLARTSNLALCRDLGSLASLGSELDNLVSLHDLR